MHIAQWAKQLCTGRARRCAAYYVLSSFQLSVGHQSSRLQLALQGHVQVVELLVAAGANTEIHCIASLPAHKQVGTWYLKA